ncbi:hypothetical protein MiYa_03210 [Microcystis aeruginosa NIES-2519]|uniref:Uncharacterized protein n=1 Tax=Microcystis aeruginosa NIES-2519 TaxID=2303981 RepID=A0A5A5R9E7_MICAE|nr:type II toxin-antitoxin system PemK/MazF family toxin [Microcystis aeruginosa]GCA71668.1 hypothetical protein MiYa_03210 [Microcystis aeruginosa NIES-2519]GCA82676.1 hypothetical protein MiHa_00627 [Microcystis aeruginosa NIES-2522]
MKPGDIVLIRFPQADLKSGKLRPALIIAISPSRHRDLLLALISSRLHQATLGFDEIINTSDSDYITTGLKVAWLSQLWWVKCILRYISQERGGGTNHKDTKDTKIDRSYVN